ncbi:MAG: hypothetical protein JNK53_07320 [Phycisphaerae bacterium]|nr:hypothetical protein [Phycisphaerae bacterium]
MITITVVAVGVLGAKMFILKPKSAAASGAKTTVTAKKAGADASSKDTERSPAPRIEALPVVPVTFETRPLRDPFVPFFLYTAPDDGSAGEGETDGQGTLVQPRVAQGGTAKSKGASNRNAKAAAEPELPAEPQGVVLKAVISGKVAVLNHVSVEEGDVMVDALGRSFLVVSVRERSVTLSDGTKTYPIGYTVAPLDGSGASKSGSKPASRGRATPTKR